MVVHPAELVEKGGRDGEEGLDISTNMIPSHPFAYIAYNHVALPLNHPSLPLPSLFVHNLLTGADSSPLKTHAIAALLCLA